MNKGAPYTKTNLANYECNECNTTFKLGEIDQHLKAHIEHAIFQKNYDYRRRGTNGSTWHANETEEWHVLIVGIWLKLQV